jgi:hypothetical protein
MSLGRYAGALRRAFMPVVSSRGDDLPAEFVQKENSKAKEAGKAFRRGNRNTSQYASISCKFYT